MIILTNTGGVAATNCYLIADETTRQAVLFDAPDHTITPLLDDPRARDFDIIGLWLTHGHFDHIADHKYLTDRFPRAKVLIHRLDEPKLIDPRTRFFSLPFTIPPGKANGYLEDGQILKLGSIDVHVIHTPGHSPGHVAFHLPAEKVLIGGDLIMMGSVGRTDLPDSDPAELYRSIRKVMKLPDDTQLLSGHGDASTLGEERRENPYVVDAINEG